jgi:hypothetical protein
VPGGDKRRGEGFAKSDAEAMWVDARIPAVIVEELDSRRIKHKLV